MTGSTNVKTKLTPQRRAIEKKIAVWRELREEGLDAEEKFDPAKYDWEKLGPLFDELSDEEWAGMWKHVRDPPRPKRPLPAERRVRDLVDDAAFSSGWFADFGEMRITRTTYLGLPQTTDGS